jgi:hypothetical protein
MAVSSNWKNLRDFLRKTHNREVNEWFADIPNAIPDNSSSRQQAKRACLILPKESQNSALLKSLTFRFVVQRTHLRPHIFGTPIGTVDSQRKYRPQIVLEFAEDEFDVVGGYGRVDGRVSFRLMNETSNTVRKTELIAMANKIKTEFGVNNGYIWKKGKDLASYVHKNKGYQFQLLVRNKQDAKDLISKVLSIQSDSPDWKYLSYKESDDAISAYPTIPGNQNILGQSYKEPRIRPIASVRFQYAYCSVWGRPNPVVLYDRSLLFNETLV